MISIANTTVTADRIKYHFDSNTCIIKDICDDERTLQIDSKILGTIENEDETLKGSKAELAEALRNKVDTVGKIGQPGEQIQNVISVGMPFRRVGRQECNSNHGITCFFESTSL